MTQIELPASDGGNGLAASIDTDSLAISFIRKGTKDLMLVRITVDGTVGVYSAGVTEYLSHPAQT